MHLPKGVRSISYRTESLNTLSLNKPGIIILKINLQKIPRVSFIGYDENL